MSDGTEKGVFQLKKKQPFYRLLNVWVLKQIGVLPAVTAVTGITAAPAV